MYSLPNLLLLQYHRLAHLTKTKELVHYPDANTTSTSGFTIHAVPTTSISDNKPSLKSPYSHTQLPSVTSILLLNTKKKVHSQGNQSVIDLFEKAKRSTLDTGTDDSSTAGLEIATDDSLMETSFISSIGSHVDNDSFLSAESDVEEPISDIDELEVDSQSKNLSPIAINDSFLSAESDVEEPLSDIDELEVDSQSKNLSPIATNDRFLSTDSDMELVSDVGGLKHNTESIQTEFSLKNENKLLPFPNLSRSWYVKEQRIHNTH